MPPPPASGAPPLRGFREGEEAASSMLMRRAPLADLGLDHEAVLRGVDVARQDAEPDLDPVGIALAELHLACSKAVALAHEHHRLALQGLDRARFDGDLDRPGRQKHTAV